MTDSLSIDVPIPSSAPSGEALFGWTWFNTAGESRPLLRWIERTPGQSTVSDFVARPCFSFFPSSFGKNARSLFRPPWILPGSFLSYSLFCFPELR